MGLIVPEGFVFSTLLYLIFIVFFQFLVIGRWSNTVVESSRFLLSLLSSSLFFFFRIEKRKVIGDEVCGVWTFVLFIVIFGI